MLNLDLNPWNIFNVSKNPVLGVSGNVLIDEKEWYNAYMPCYFEPKDISIVEKLKREIDQSNSNPKLIKNSLTYRDYLKMQKEYSETDNFVKIVFSLKNRVNFFFNKIEKKLFEVEFDNSDIISLLSLVLAGLNLMQEYMDPVEALATLKKSVNIPTLEGMIEGLGDMTILDKTPSSEIAYIPMVVLVESGIKNEPIERVIHYFEQLFEIERDVLLESSNYSNKLYNYTKYMPVSVAEKLINNTATKIDFLTNLTAKEMSVYKLQELNGVMTWSKNILTNKNKNYRRYDSTNNILSVIKETSYVNKNRTLYTILTPKTISGSEKQAMLIYLLKYIELDNYEMYDQIKIKATEYYNFSKT